MVDLGISRQGCLTSEVAIATVLIPPYVNITINIDCKKPNILFGKNEAKLLNGFCFIMIPLLKIIKIPKTTKIIKMIIFITDITDSMYPKCLAPSLFIPITIIKETKANKDYDTEGIQYFKNISVAIASEAEYY